MRRWGFAPFCAACPARHAVVASLARTLVCAKSALFRPCNIHRHLPSQAFIRWWVFCRVPGFALGCGAGFKPFWPLGLAQRAPPAIILQALRRLRGAVLFRGLRPSSIQWFLFWLLGLTVQSSRPAFGGRLTFGVRRRNLLYGFGKICAALHLF